MKKMLTLTVMAFLISQLWSPLRAQDQKIPKAFDEKGKKLELTRGTNPNILKDKPATDEDFAKSPVKPPAKKAPDSKLKQHKIWVQNDSKFAIDFYLDGNWTLTVAPKITDYLFVPEGTVTLYATSLFKTVEWGPRSIKLSDDYLWKLTYAQ